MAILNWFGKKQDHARKAGLPVRPAESASKQAGKTPHATDKKAPAKIPGQSVSAKSDSADNGQEKVPSALTRITAHTVLRGVHITEKSAIAQQDGKYIFDIFPSAASPVVKQAVEHLYKVHVQNVQIVKVRPQKRHRGRFVSLHKRSDKAIVTLRKGETIDVMA